MFSCGRNTQFTFAEKIKLKKEQFKNYYKQTFKYNPFYEQIQRRLKGVPRKNSVK